MTDRELVRAAQEARAYAYAPYSGFRVGVALLTEEGRVYSGCNIENAAYSPSNCAERTAIFKAVSEGQRNFRGIAIVGGGTEGCLQMCPPCGVCRQVMMEFCNPESFYILLGTDDGKIQRYTLGQLLPQGFGAKNLEWNPEEER